MTAFYLSLAIALACGFAPPLLAGEIIFESGIEYSSPGDEHLQLNLARPKEVKEGTKLPAVICITKLDLIASQAASASGGMDSASNWRRKTTWR